MTEEEIRNLFCIYVILADKKPDAEFISQIKQITNKDIDKILLWINQEFSKKIKLKENFDVYQRIYTRGILDTYAYHDFKWMTSSLPSLERVDESENLIVEISKKDAAPTIIFSSLLAKLKKGTEYILSWEGFSIKFNFSNKDDLSISEYKHLELAKYNKNDIFAEHEDFNLPRWPYDKDADPDYDPMQEPFSKDRSDWSVMK